MTLVALFIHLLAVICWLGSAMFILIAFVPAMRADATRDAARLLLRSAAGRLRAMGWTALILIFLSGGYLMTPYLRIDGFWSSPKAHALLGMLGAFVLVVILSGLHDFIYGPRASRGEPGDPATEKARKLARIIGMVNLLAGLIAVFCGAMLRVG